MSKSILQIIPAQGWYAVHKLDGDSEQRNPLVCWALVEDEDGDRFVTGLDGADYVDFCDDNSNFARYEHEAGLFEERAGSKWVKPSP